MNDQTAWERAVTAAGNIYTSMPHCTAAQLNAMIDDIIRLKQNLVDIATSAGSSRICRDCGGECCRFGKYHVSILDILVYLRNGTALVAPDFSTHPACPYADESGCTMPPGYRPMTCVVFNCQQVEDQLSVAERGICNEYEQKLRTAIGRAGQITGMRLDRAILLSGS